MEAAAAGKETLLEMQGISDAEPQDLGQSQVSQVREYLDGDLFAFAWFVFGFQDLVPELHGKIATLLERWGTPGWERIMIQIPREFFKTSLCTIANPLWQVARQPNLPVAIFNEKQDNAEMWVRTIRDTVRGSALFHMIYKDLLPPGIGPNEGRTMPRWWKWNDREIVLQRDRAQPEASICANGIGSACAGRHWPKTIKDDLISEDAAKSPSVMQTAKDWFDKSLYLERPALKGWDLVACTPWAYDDVYAHILRTYDYKLYRRAALEDKHGDQDINGESIFPSKLTTAELRKHYDRDNFGYMSQMQCTPRPGKDQSFDAGWIRWGSVSYADPERPKFVIRDQDFDPSIKDQVRLGETPPQVVPISLMSKIVFLDPAPSEQRDINRDKKARNGALVVGMDAWGRKFVLEDWADRIDPLDVINQMFKLMDKWGTNVLGIEEVVFSILYRHWITEESFRRGRMVRMLKLKPGNKDKDTRITSLIPGYRQGLYYHNQGSTKALVKEMAEYPYGTTRDLLDAHAYDYKLQRPRTLEEEQHQALQARVASVGRNPVTGY